MLIPKFAVLNLSYVDLLFLWIEVNKIYWNSKIIVESCFQQFYWSNEYDDSENDILNNKW